MRNLADATDIKVDISPDSPVVSISPTHELIVDVTKRKVHGNWNRNDGATIYRW